MKAENEAGAYTGARFSLFIGFLKKLPKRSQNGSQMAPKPDPRHPQDAPRAPLKNSLKKDPKMGARREPKKIPLKGPFSDMDPPRCSKELPGDPMGPPRVYILVHFKVFFCTFWDPKGKVTATQQPRHGHVAATQLNMFHCLFGTPSAALWAFSGSFCAHFL